MAEDKFWNLPELIERLISLLDPLSALCLLQSHVIDREILQKSLSYEAWNKLIRRNSYGGEGLLQAEDVKDFVKILKLMELEEPSTFLLPLLDLICESGPSESPKRKVQVTCPNHPEPHSVSPEAFLLLEEVEGAFGTAEQSIKSILAYDLEFWHEFLPAFPKPFFFATSSRMSRQKGVVTSIYIDGDIWIEDESSAQAFTTLLQAQEVILGCAHLKVGGAIGEEGWKELGRALRGRAGQVDMVMRGGQGKQVSISKEALAAARKEDMEVVEEWHYTELVVFNKENRRLPVWDHTWDDTWARLKQVSDMTEDEFLAECEQEERRWRSEEEGPSEPSEPGDDYGYDEDASEPEGEDGVEGQGEEDEDDEEGGSGEFPQLI